MKCHIKIYLCIIFFAFNVNLLTIKTSDNHNNIESNMRLKIYKNKGSVKGKSSVELCKNEDTKSLSLLKNQEFQEEEQTQLSKSIEESPYNAQIFYHLVKCVSRLEAFLPIKVQNNENEKIQKKCPKGKDPSILYDISRDDISLMYQCFLNDFECSNKKENELECLLEYLGLKFGKVNYSEFNLTESEIEEEIQTNHKFINERIEYIIINDSKQKQEEIYVILHQKVEAEEEENCSICLDEITNISSYKLSCGHKFHDECIKEWSSLNKKCPLCRSDINEDNYKDNLLFEYAKNLNRVSDAEHTIYIYFNSFKRKLRDLYTQNSIYFIRIVVILFDDEFRNNSWWKDTSDLFFEGLIKLRASLIKLHEECLKIHSDITDNTGKIIKEKNLTAINKLESIISNMPTDFEYSSDFYDCSYNSFLEKKFKNLWKVEFNIK